MTRPSESRTILSAALLLGAAAVMLSGCASQTSPATGRTFYSSMDTGEEASLGAEEHPKILAEFGGAYSEKRSLNGYVSQVGQVVAKNAERKDVSYTFTVLNSDEINAFALPGGYVYITRGLLALANNEAEIAGVLGHEVGHVNARHTAERAGKQQTTQILGALGVLLGTALGGDTGGQLMSGVGSELGADYLGSFSQQQEFEADSLGVRYLTKASYDPQAMASFLDSLNNETNLEAKLSGTSTEVGTLAQMKQSHPRTPDRVQKAIEEAKVPIANPQVNSDRFLQQIDGMMWGTDPREGVIKGSTFIHPGLKFAFNAPKGMKLKNSPDAVIGSGNNAAMLFDLASPAPSGGLEQYVASQWQEGAKISNLESFEVNGMEAATGLAKGTINETPVVVRMIAIRQSAKTVYRFMYAAPTGSFNAMDKSFLASAQSFHEINAQEASGYQPKRIRVVTVQSGDTMASLAQQMQVDEAPAEWFRVLNHLGANAKLQAGQKVKIVVNGGAQVSALPVDAAAQELALVLQ